MAIYAGSTPKYLIKIKDEQGLQLNPASALQVTGVRVYIYNSISGVEVGRFYYGTAPVPTTGWTLMTVKYIGDNDYRVQLILTAAQTIAAEGNSNKIQINASVPDADVPGGTRVIIKTGEFSEIVKSKS